MIKTSGFTFVHNAIKSGYPIVEAIQAVQPYVDETVVVDMQSTDNTREILNQLEVRVVDGIWDCKAGETLANAHYQYLECEGDIIVHFEADEVYDDRLIGLISGNIQAGLKDIAVYRLQLEQNFQRCRWYPELVHRTFPNDGMTKKVGHTTNRHKEAYAMSQRGGYLWDIANCFRGNWFSRVEKQAELRGNSPPHHTPQYLMCPLHCTQPVILSREDARLRLNEPHWRIGTTPFNIPDILRPLVGMTWYKPVIRELEEKWKQGK